MAAGDTILSQSVLRQVIGAVSAQPADAIGRGHSNAEIAAKLFISVTTVKTHIGPILDKLDVANRVQTAVCIHNAQR